MFLLSLGATSQVCTVSLKAGLDTYNALEPTAPSGRFSPCRYRSLGAAAHRERSVARPRVMGSAAARAKGVQGCVRHALLLTSRASGTQARGGGRRAVGAGGRCVACDGVAQANNRLHPTPGAYLGGEAGRPSGAGEA
jgi:hypothetical protein